MNWSKFQEECKYKKKVYDNRYICEHEDASGCSPACMRPSCPIF